MGQEELVYLVQVSPRIIFCFTYKKTMHNFRDCIYHGNEKN